MSANSRDRVHARKRYEKYQARQERRADKESRNRALGVSITLLLVLALLVYLKYPKSPHEPEAVDPYAAETSQPADQPTDQSTDQATDQPTDAPTPEDTPAPNPRHTNADGMELSKPDPALAENRAWTGTLTLNGQPVTLTLDGAKAPQAVANFVYLAQEGYFDNTTCHRLTTTGIFVLQCGDPEASGMGGPGYTWGPIENAPADNVYKTGTLAMARVGGSGDSMGSQFFIVYQDSTIPSDNAGGYTVFGEVTDGLPAVQQIADAGVSGGQSDGAPATPATIDKVEVQ